MNKIKIDNLEFNFLCERLYFVFKKQCSFNFNPYMFGLASKLRKQYDMTSQTLSINNKDLDKVLYILNLPNLIEKRKKYKAGGMFEKVEINGFFITVSKYRKHDPTLRLRKNKCNKLLRKISRQTKVKPKNTFPKYIMMHSLGAKKLSRKF